MGDRASEEIELAPLTQEEAQHTLTWRYPAEFSTYDLDGSELAVMLNPANRYHAIHHAGEYIGYVCFGVEARVPGLDAAEGIEDFGMGLAPDRVGQGLSRWLLPALLSQLREMGVLSAGTVRVVILDWNLRSQRAALAAGFTPVGELEGRDGTFIVMTRPLALS